MIRMVESIELQDELRHFWRSDYGMRLGRAWGQKNDRRGLVAKSESQGRLTGEHVNVVPRPYVGYASTSLAAEWDRPRAVEGKGLPAPKADISFGERRLVDNAQLYWVAAPMVEVIQAAAPTMPNQVLVEGDLPCECGFAIYQKPMVITDTYGGQINVSAVGWQPMTDSDTGKTGTVVSHYSDVDGADAYGVGDVVKEARESGINIPRLLLLHVEAFRFGESLVPLDLEFVIPEGLDVTQEQLRNRVDIQRKAPLALWTLCQQTLAKMTVEKAPREFRRRLEKAGSPLATSTIRVVTLRRIAEEHPTVPAEEHVEWSHRWIVSGHWRNQWLPSRQMHRVQWIHAFVKGPADKPLVMKKTINRLSR